MTDEGVATVGERVRNAAERGDIEALHGLTREKPGFLKDIDEMEFVDTPLHIAAAKGRTEFAMELAYLKPSFLTKLNQDWLSPIHLALLNKHKNTVLSLLKFDKNLPRLKGKNCYTPLHYVVMIMKKDLVILKKFLMDCPECIHDVTNHDETALHIAARYNNSEALQVLLNWLWITDHSVSDRRKFWNLQNRDGNAVLHIAAYNNQPKIIRFLWKNVFLINWKATNLINLTALDILQRGNQKENKECIDILRKTDNWFWATYIMLFITYNPFNIFDQMGYEIRNMSGDRRNALLIATVLILTATYQAALSPPGGVFPPNSQSDQQNTTLTPSLQVHSGAYTKPWWQQAPFKLKRSPFNSGSSVLSTVHFLSFFIPNVAAFCISFFVTCLALINILPGVLSVTLVLALLMLLGCLLVSAVLIISPNSQSLNFMLKYVYFLIYFICLIILGQQLAKLRKTIWKRRFMRDLEMTNNKS